VNFKLQNKASFVPGLSVYRGPPSKSRPCASHNTGRERLWNVGSVNEYEALSAIIPFVGVIIQREYELRQQVHLIFSLLSKNEYRLIKSPV
jgi:hypothetical protein